MQTNMAPTLYLRYINALNNSKQVSASSSNKKQTGFFVRPDEGTKNKNTKLPNDISETALEIFRDIRSKRNIS